MYRTWLMTHPKFIACRPQAGCVRSSSGPWRSERVVRHADMLVERAVMRAVQQLRGRAAQARAQRLVVTQDRGQIFSLFCESLHLFPERCVFLLQIFTLLHHREKTKDIDLSIF